jgi:hypothetical protein
MWHALDPVSVVISGTTLGLDWVIQNHGTLHPALLGLDIGA